MTTPAFRYSTVAHNIMHASQQIRYNKMELKWTELNRVEKDDSLNAVRHDENDDFYQLNDLFIDGMMTSLTFLHHPFHLSVMRFTCSFAVSWSLFLNIGVKPKIHFVHSMGDRAADDRANTCSCICHFICSNIQFREWSERGWKSFACGWSRATDNWPACFLFFLYFLFSKYLLSPDLKV